MQTFNYLLTAQSTSETILFEGVCLVQTAAILAQIRGKNVECPSYFAGIKQHRDGACTDISRCAACALSGVQHRSPCKIFVLSFGFAACASSIDGHLLITDQNLSLR